MFREESLWLNDLFAKEPLEQGAKVLDIGSSTEYFRRVEQPYIDYHVFRPLRKRGVEAVHVDVKEADGVDLVVDLTVPDLGSTLDSLPRGDIVLCSNLLEHVTDRELVVGRLRDLTASGGLLVVTVPHVYPYHPDPIDTLFRPTDAELAALVGGDGFERVESAILEVENPRRPEEPARAFWNVVPYGLFRLQSRIRHPLPPQAKVSAVAMRKPKPTA
jgi:SAM-dependent methyltransferase